MNAAKHRTSWTYRGVLIFRNTEPGFRLRYTARLDDGTPLAADTLAGMRKLIGPARLTFDDAQDAFRDKPSAKTAADYLATARTYYADKMIGPKTLKATLAETRAYTQKESAHD